MSDITEECEFACVCSNVSQIHDVLTWRPVYFRNSSSSCSNTLVC